LLRASQATPLRLPASERALPLRTQKKSPDPVGGSGRQRLDLRAVRRRARR
jgi:hypothetical protein